MGCKPAKNPLPHSGHFLMVHVIISMDEMSLICEISAIGFYGDIENIEWEFWKKNSDGNWSKLLEILGEKNS